MALPAQPQNHWSFYLAYGAQWDQQRRPVTREPDRWTVRQTSTPRPAVVAPTLQQSMKVISKRRRPLSGRR
jgi:hypothetical protein